MSGDTGQMATRNPGSTHQLRLVVFPIIYIVLDIPGGAEFLPSTVPAYIRQNTIVKQRNLQNSGGASHGSGKIHEGRGDVFYMYEK